MLVRSIRGMGDEGWLGSPAVVDLDGDRVNELVVARGARVSAYSPSGVMRWTAAVAGLERVWAAPVIADFTGDRSLEGPPRPGAA